MMIDLKTVIYVIGGVISVGTAIVSFFVMQAKQNMKIEELEREVCELKKELEKKIQSLNGKQSKSTEYQIETEKTIVEINTKLDHILEAIAELKKGQLQTVRGNH